MQSVTSSLSETAADKRAASPLGWGRFFPSKRMEFGSSSPSICLYLNSFQNKVIGLAYIGGWSKAGLALDISPNKGTPS
ncbi:hypothetical protein SLE2022_403950 [Rubroshorea leprosula]|uniref:Uncharacterized protein n=1 Tax=Rubroshorea leprosula TaxID=152421 RepID=A0AAV5MVX7_9ROSI|nr:hypothetical protein SLEP1_g60117 [Rubroshorea leprosula]